MRINEHQELPPFVVYEGKIYYRHLGYAPRHRLIQNGGEWVRVTIGHPLYKECPLEVEIYWAEGENKRFWDMAELGEICIVYGAPYDTIVVAGKIPDRGKEQEKIRYNFIKPICSQ